MMINLLLLKLNHCIIICKHHVLTRFLKNVLDEEGDVEEEEGEEEEDAE